jgi:hypothetical protein
MLHSPASAARQTFEIQRLSVLCSAGGPYRRHGFDPLSTGWRAARAESDEATMRCCRSVDDMTRLGQGDDLRTCDHRTDSVAGRIAVTTRTTQS